MKTSNERISRSAAAAAALNRNSANGANLDSVTEGIKTMKTILQVEDDPNDVFLFKHAMKRAGLANPVQIATDGQEAIDYLYGEGKFADRAKFPYPCLVLLDLK